MSQSRGKAYTNKTSLDSSTNTSKSSARNDNQNSDVEKMGNSLKKWLVGSKEEPKEVYLINDHNLTLNLLNITYTVYSVDMSFFSVLY